MDSWLEFEQHFPERFFRTRRNFQNRKYYYEKKAFYFLSEFGERLWTIVIQLRNLHYFNLMPSLPALENDMFVLASSNYGRLWALQRIGSIQLSRT